MLARGRHGLFYAPACVASNWAVTWRFKRVSGGMSERVSERKSDRITERVSERMSERIGCCCLIRVEGVLRPRRYEN